MRKLVITHTSEIDGGREGGENDDEGKEGTNHPVPLLLVYHKTHLNASYPPKSRSIKAAILPVGTPPPLGLRQFQ
jgi:hypothetical protein